MSGWDPLVSSLLSASPAHCVQAGFLLTSAFVLAVFVAPAAERKLLLSYGPRRSQQATTASPESKTIAAGQADDKDDALVRAVRKVTSMGQVPHSWFFTYYAFYILCAGLWAVQYFQTSWGLLRFIASRQMEVAPASSTMAGSQVAVAWCMMLLQAGRRLYECCAVMRPSKTTMWFVHWLLGLAFYLGVSVAIWIEGSAAVLQNQVRFTGAGILTAGAIGKAAVALPLFLYGWIMQHRCHKHLAGLKKYSLPDQGMFRHLVCPHYTCECLIYFSLATVTAPEGQWCNRTLLSVLMFVAVNLGVTAHGTRNWYVEKFGPGKVMSRWMMIPFLY